MVVRVSPAPRMALDKTIEAAKDICTGAQIRNRSGAMSITSPVVTVDALLTNDTTPQLTGTTDDPTAAISVTVDGNVYAATNNGDGTWTLADDTISPALVEGFYDVIISATDLAGNPPGTDSSTNELEIDTTGALVTIDPLTTNDTSPRLTGTFQSKRS